MCSEGISCGSCKKPKRYSPQQRAIITVIAIEKSYVNINGSGNNTSSPARKNLIAAANSRKPITTLTLLSQLPLLGSFFNIPGNNASRKNGDAKVTEKANPPSRRWRKVRFDPEAVPPKPPRNGATQAKLTIVKVSAMKMVPTIPPCPCLELVKCANPLGSSISYMPSRLKEKKTKRHPRPKFMAGCTLSKRKKESRATAAMVSTITIVRL